MVVETLARLSPAVTRKMNSLLKEQAPSKDILDIILKMFPAKIQMLKEKDKLKKEKLKVQILLHFIIPTLFRW